MKPNVAYATLAAALAFCFLPAAALGQPAALKARKVHDRIRLQVDAGDSPKPTNTVVYSVDTSTAEFETLEANKQFVAAGSAVAITVPHFNPLKTALIVTVDDAPDPSHETISKLVEGLLSVSTILGAKLDSTAALQSNRTAALALGITDPEKTCAPAETIIKDLVDTLNDQIFSGARLKTEISASTNEIDTHFALGGSVAIGAGVRRLEAFLETDDPQKPSLRKALAAADGAIKKLEAVIAKKDLSACERALMPTYLVAKLANPGERLKSLTQIVKAVSDIVAYLRAYEPSTRWSRADGSEFIAKRDINPTPSTMKKVKVAFLSRQYEESGNTPGLMVVKATDAASVEFIVRRYSAWIPEIGVGLTFARVDRPAYGTSKNAAGETVIAKVKSKEGTAVDPSLMVNFVCGFCGLTPLTPMFQIGVSTSKTTPALFLGGGIRFAATSKGDFAIGYGAVFPWAKQLEDNDDLGKPIAGTAELEERLKWRRITGLHSYLVVQYKF